MISQQHTLEKQNENVQSKDLEPLYPHDAVAPTSVTQEVKEEFSLKNKELQSVNSSQIMLAAFVNIDKSHHNLRKENKGKLYSKQATAQTSSFLQQDEYNSLMPPQAQSVSKFGRSTERQLKKQNIQAGFS